jgi:hypothetical protein
MYLTYDEYTDYGGTLDETAFQDMEYDAESEINWYTFNRLKRPEWATALESEELKRCMYQLIRIKQMESELLASSTGGAGFGVGWTKEAGITQESNDGVSVSYNTMSSGELMAYFNGSKTKEDLINKYLNGVLDELGRSILYRGIYPGE